MKINFLVFKFVFLITPSSLIGLRNRPRSRRRRKRSKPFDHIELSEIGRHHVKCIGYCWNKSGLDKYPQNQEWWCRSQSYWGRYTKVPNPRQENFGNIVNKIFKFALSLKVVYFGCGQYKYSYWDFALTPPTHTQFRYHQSCWGAKFWFEENESELIFPFN